jgi:5-formyltetrahydrofolate cyclo-ligase
MSSSSSDDVRAQKQALRKQIRSRIQEVSPEDIASQSAQVWERLFALPEYQQAKGVGLFLSMPKHEINTDVALSDAIQNGKTVYVPKVGKNFELADMDLIQVILPKGTENDDGIFHASWPRNKWGIPEPPESMECVAAQVGDIDLLVVPGLAFDANGGRLGQGKGYYDRFIARMLKDGSDKPKLVAVGLEPQFVTDADIPVTEHDFTMDMILLPNQTITVTKQS